MYNNMICAVVILIHMLVTSLVLFKKLLFSFIVKHLSCLIVCVGIFQRLLTVVMKKHNDPRGAFG